MEKVAAYTDRVTPDGEWRAGNPTTNEPATPMLSPYFNMLQREMLAVLAQAGIEPDKANDSQIAAAIAKLISDHSAGRNHPMASTGERGMVRFATESEHQAAARDDRATTPAGVKQMVQQFLAPRVSLVGPSLVFPDTTNTYTITDYSDFSTYEASASRGTATIDGDTVTLVVGAGEASGALDLIVTRDGLDVVNEVAVGEQSIARPSLVYPGNGDTDVDLQPTLQASSFQTYPTDSDSHVSSDWQIATDENFTNIVASTTADQQNLTSWPLPESLPLDTLLYGRIRQTGNSLGQTEWSPVVSFTTTSQYIVTPTITSPADGATDVPEQPVLEVSPFETNPASVDTHAATSWWIYDDLGDIVWQSLNDSTNLTSIIPPAGVLQESGVYRPAAQFHGTTLPDSAVSPEVTFTTSEQFIPTESGEPFGGGFFTATMYDENNSRYALVTSSKAEGELAPSHRWPAGNDFCEALNIAGLTDWKLPTFDELIMMYRTYKPGTQQNVTSVGATDRVSPALGNYTTNNPTRTPISAFQTGGSEAFIEIGGYWSSEYTPPELGGPTSIYKDFNNGNGLSGVEFEIHYSRAVRRVYF